MLLLPPTLLEMGRLELRVEDSGHALLTLDGYPTSSGIYAQEQRCSPKTPETPEFDFLDRGCAGLYGLL